MRLLNSSLDSLLLLVVVISLAAAVPSEQTQEATSSHESVTQSQSLRGLSMNNNKNNRKPRIVGGSNVPDPDRYPYFSLMSGSGLCGAVLISKRFVLTAAHCVGADNDFEIGGIEYPYKRLKVHPRYDESAFANDIAIFELESDVPSKLSPIRLEQNPVEEDGTSMTVIGFGSTVASDDDEIDYTSDKLLRTVVDYVPQDECQASMSEDPISDDMLCAYKQGSDSCQGDSGGPLLLESSTNDDGSGDLLVGLVSWGNSCAKTTPGVYARISHFYDWIVQSMCDMNPSGAPDTVDCTFYDTPDDSGSDTEITPVPTFAPSLYETTDTTTDFPSNYEWADYGDDWFNNDDDSFSLGGLFSYFFGL